MFSSSPLSSVCCCHTANAAMSGRGGKSKVATTVRSSLDVAAVDELLNEVPSSFHTAREFNPFTHYNDSVDELTEYSDAVREAIEHVVEAHYKGFNQATAAFTHVVQQFKTAQSNVQQLTGSLADSKRLLTASNERLREQWRQTQTLNHINHSLAKLAYLVTLPAHMTVLEERKQYLHCVILISHTLTLLSSEDTREVEGLLELREDVINRRNNIVDALLHHTQQLLYHKHRRDGTAHSIDQPADVEEGHGATNSTNGSGSGNSSAVRFQTDGVQHADTDSASTVNSASSTPSVGSASLSSSSSTMAFLTSNVLSPFHPSNNHQLDFALPADSSVLSDPAWRSVTHLLHEERAAAFVTAPYGQPQRALFLVVAALDHINALPSAKLQLSRAVRQEVTTIVHDIKQRIKLHSGNKRRKRIVAEGGQSALELSSSARPLASPSHRRVTPLSTAAATSTRSSTLNARPSQPNTALPRVSSADRGTLTDMLSLVFAALMSALRMHSQLIHITAMVQRARRDMQAAADATQQQSQSQQQSAEKKKAVGKKEPTASTDREDSRWSLLHVWSTMQIELQVLLQELLLNSADSQLKLGSGSGSGVAPADGGKAGKKGQVGELELTFSFDDASAPSIARMSRGKDDKSLSVQINERRQHQAAVRREQKALVPPSPYNITVLYRPVLHFCRQVQQLCQSSMGRERDVSDASGQLLSFLSLFVHSSFLPRLQADVNIRVDGILAEQHAFDRWESPSDDASQQSTAALLLAFFNFSPASYSTNSLAFHYVSPSSTSARLQCVVGVCELVLLLLSDAATLPSFAAEYVSVVDSALNRLQTACHDRYVDAGRGVYSTSRLMDSALVTAMEHEQPYMDIIMQQQQRQQYDTADNAPSSSFSASNPLYAPSFSPDFSLRPDQLMNDTRNVAQLCLLHSSLEWLCDQLYQTVRLHHHQQHQRSEVPTASTSAEIGAAGSPLPLLLNGDLSHSHRIPSFRLDAQRLKEEASQPIAQHNDSHDGQHSETQSTHTDCHRCQLSHSHCCGHLVLTVCRCCFRFVPC